MDRLKKLNVFYHDIPVGTRALYQNRLAAFEYDRDWISSGFSISPFSLPLEPKVFMPKQDPFDGLFGVFADSLPDGWGRLLVDRLLRRNGIDPESTGNLDRLAIVGDSGMGALTYRPVIELNESDKMLSYDEIARECERILHDDTSEDLDFLFAKGGSSGGARPKILTRVDGEEWIIKFPSTQDKSDIGRQEYDYALCAVECGIQMEEVRLFPSEICSGYFGVKRFDRSGPEGMNRLHMLSVSGMLETSHRIPNLDYDLLMRLTLQLTKDMGECMRLFRLMCFNVFAHNRDDHSKNFSYLYLENERRWTLAPAYDLTYSYSIGGEHATTVHGNGRDPGMKDVLAVAGQIGLNGRESRQAAEEIREIVHTRLADYL